VGLREAILIAASSENSTYVCVTYYTVGYANLAEKSSLVEVGVRELRATGEYARGVRIAIFLNSIDALSRGRD
jgi:hypothetical protein